MQQRQRGRFTEQLKRDSRQRLESGKRSAATHIEEVANAIDRASEQLDQNEPTLAAYAGQIAAGVGKLATRLREDSFDKLLGQTRQLARRNPALFLAGGVALGIALSRFLKASAEPSDEESSTAAAGEQPLQQAGAATESDTQGFGRSGATESAVPRSEGG